MGAPTRDHRVRDRVRHRPARPAPLPPRAWRVKKRTRGALVVAAAASGLGAIGYGAQRVAARRVRKRPDDDARRVLDAPLYTAHELESHDAGTIHAVVAGADDAPPIVLSHGVTLSIRTWFYQLEA